MTISDIDEILTGTFSDPADRKYWENKREELLTKEKTIKDNEDYFKKMAKYNR